MYRNSVLPKLVVFIALAEGGKVDVLERTDREANMLWRHWRSTNKRGGLFRRIFGVNDLIRSVGVCRFIFCLRYLIGHVA